MRALGLLLVFMGSACGGGDTTPPQVPDSTPSPDACVATGGVTLDVTGPDTFTCHQNFRATFTVTNDTCQIVTVTSVGIAASVVSSTGNCTPPSPNSYPAVVTSVLPGHSAVVQDITGNPFCCFQMSCPADFTCDESYLYTAVTSAGTIMQTVSPIHVNLQSCDVICP